MVSLFSRTNQYVVCAFEVHIIYEGLFFSEINQQHNTTPEKHSDCVHGYGLKKGARRILPFVFKIYRKHSSGPLMPL